MAADPQVISMIKKAAAKYGADPVAMLATSLTEDGARKGVVGDNGTSFGPFQFHIGGALGKNAPAWASTQDAIDNRAREFARLGAKGGKGAAAIQRPADPAGYALKVDGNLKTAAQLLKLPSGADSTIPNPSQTAPKASSVQGQGQPVSPFGLTAGNLLDAAKSHLGTTKASSGISFIEQAFGQQSDPLQQGAPLPSGGFSSVQVNKLKTEPGVDPKLSPSGQGIVQAALKFKGTPYSWGGGGVNGPTKGIAQGAKTTGFDCSGLVQYSVFQATGKKIPRLAATQFADSTKVPLKNAKPGDIVAFGTAKDVHHIGIYIGDGKFIEAPHTGSVVKISTLAGRSDLVGVGRYS